MDGAGDVSQAQDSDAAVGNRSTARDGYWFREDDSAVELLAALRTYQAAHTALRRRTSAAMDMNTTDLAALRHVIAHETREEPLTARALARHLGISGPSTSKLLDRLTASGHLRRAPNARDGRSSVVLATAHGHAQVRERLSGMHERMHAIAEEVPGEVRTEVAAFLRGIAHVLEGESSSADPLTPADDQARQS